jgi:hypothetical protein
MAGYRQFHTKFWKDEWVIDLDPLKKYLFCYLFTNELSSISGIYKLPMKVIENETGLDKKFIVSTLAEFQNAKKIAYQDNVMWVVSMRKLHKNASPTTMTKVDNDIADIPDCLVKQAYLYYQETEIYSIDTVSILNSESLSKSKNGNENKKEIPIENIVFPQSLDTPSFKETWNRWLVFRSEIKHKVTPSTQSSQFKMLSKYPEPVAIQMLEQSITNGWQGLFELKSNNKVNKNDIASDNYFMRELEKIDNGK